MSAVAPGGDGDGALGAHLNPFKRKQQKPVAWWSGIVQVGPEGKELVYEVPDYFNGTLRVMAVAVTEEAMGTTEKKTIVRGDFVINPNAPMVLAPGDETEVSASIANNVTGSGKGARGRGCALSTLGRAGTAPHARRAESAAALEDSLCPGVEEWQRLARCLLRGRCKVSGSMPPSRAVRSLKT